MEKAQIELVQNELRNILFPLFYHNEFDIDVFTEDGGWIVGASMMRLRRDEIETYLEQHSIEPAAEMPQISYKSSAFVTESCASLVGEILYNGIHHPENQIVVKFQCLLVFVDEAWKIKQLVTTNQYNEENYGWRDTRVDEKLLISSVPMGIVCCDWDSYLRVELINKFALNMLGYDSVRSFKQQVGTSFLGAIHPDDVNNFRTYIGRLETMEIEDYVQFRVRKSDFTYLWVQALGMIAEEKWLVLTCADYTPHKERLEDIEKQKSQLWELQEGYRHMIDNMPSGFHSCALFDPVHVDYVSESLCRLTGYSQYDIHETMHSNYLGLVAPEDHHVIIEAVKSLMKYPHTMQIEYRIKRKDGTLVPVMDRMRSARDTEGKMWGYSIVLEQEANPQPMTDPLPNIGAKFATEEIAAEELKDRVEIHTFGYFEVLVDGHPIAFRSAKARELLAFLVDRRGNYVSRENIITALWENETVNPVTVTRCRKTYKYLVDELKSYGIEAIVSTENNMRRLVKDNVSCDLYKYIDGDQQAKDAFMGAYLNEYSWAEITLSSLLQQFEYE